MKELSIEEKAKAYDEALEKARELYNDERTHVGITPIHLTEIFPELKDSEDERIRKEIITHCRNTICVTEEGAEKIAKWISWLEKQGGQKIDPDDIIEESYQQQADDLIDMVTEKSTWSEEDEKNLKRVI